MYIRNGVVKMKAMNIINENDFREMVSFALNEYGNSKLRKIDFGEDGRFEENFGSLVASVSMIPVDKGRLYIRRYDVVDKCGSKFISFILGHAAMLFGMSMKYFREQLLENEGIEGIITLKQSIFKEIRIPAAIIILGNKNDETWLTSADNIEVLLDSFYERFSEKMSVYYTSELSADNMMPERYNGEIQSIEDDFQGRETKKLSEIAEVINGKGANKREYADSGIPYLRARDIQEGKITRADVYIDTCDVSRFSKQLIQPGDILLTKHFGQHKLALVTEGDVPAIASNMLFIIRPFGVSEGYLYNYLTSKTGNEVFKRQLNYIQRGVTIPSIALSDLKNVLVPLYDKETMHNMENVEVLTKDEIIHTSKKLISSIRQESGLEREVKQQFIQAGWKEEGFSQETVIMLQGGTKRWKADFAYCMKDGRTVIIEVKSDLTKIDGEWLGNIREILTDKQKYIFILTTGVYYEVHISGVENSLKLLRVPTIEEILNWEKGVH